MKEMPRKSKRKRLDVLLRLEPEIVRMLDDIAEMRDCSRVALIRIFIIERLSDLGFIPAPVLKRMGLAPREEPSPLKIQKEG